MNKVFVIAEAGVNHNGSLKCAEEMIYAAKKSGADAIKFQTYVTSELVTKNAGKADYQKKNTSVNESQFEMLKKLEFSSEDFKYLKNVCDKIGIEFISAPFDLESVRVLLDIGVDTFKLPSGEVTNYPLLLELAKTKKTVIMSSGMCTLDEVKQSIEILKEHGTPELALLHCTTEYPAPYSEVNLNVINTLKEFFNIKVGYSDHTPGIVIPIAAVACGAEIIEKHFTLDKNMEGPDHKASLNPRELCEMVQAIRNVESAMGDGIKVPAESEKRNISIARKSIVAKRTINKGELFTEENLTTKRPGDGISPMQWNMVLGQRAKRTFTEDELIEI